MKQVVVILGASSSPDRYAYKAFKLLKRHGHTILLVNPNLNELEGEKVFSNLSEIQVYVDTVTVYVSEKISTGLKDEIIKLNPKRVIFNPGSENTALQTALVKAGIKVEEACTLVLLNTHQF